MAEKKSMLITAKTCTPVKTILSLHEGREVMKREVLVLG